LRLKTESKESNPSTFSFLLIELNREVFPLVDAFLKKSAEFLHLLRVFLRFYNA
jgi:hypothetical protein